MEELTPQNRKRLSLIPVSKKLGCGRRGSLAQVERNIAAGRAGRSGNPTTDRSRTGESVVPIPALTALAVEDVADDEDQATPPAGSSPVPPVLNSGLSLGQTYPAFIRVSGRAAISRLSKLRGG